MHLPIQETHVQSLGWKDPLEGGNGNPLQYSCMDNSVNRGTWQATVHGVESSQTQLSTHKVQHGDGSRFLRSMVSFKEDLKVPNKVFTWVSAFVKFS